VQYCAINSLELNISVVTLDTLDSKSQRPAQH